jgi:hypothetical protein
MSGALPDAKAPTAVKPFCGALSIETAPQTDLLSRGDATEFAQIDPLKQRHRRANIDEQVHDDRHISFRLSLLDYYKLVSRRPKEFVFVRLFEKPDWRTRTGLAQPSLQRPHQDAIGSSAWRL